MMRRIFTVALILGIMFSLAGCNSRQPKQYESFVADGTNDGISIPVEQQIWTGTYTVQNELVGKTVTISFNGKEYSGVYKKSIVDKLNSYRTDVFYGDDLLKFGISTQDNSLAFINLMTKSFFATEPYLDDVDDPEGTAITVAKTIAAQYLEDISKYEMITEEPRVSVTDKDGKSYCISYHVITFARKIGAYYTSDYISIKVTSKGNVASVFTGDINAFQNETVSFEEDLILSSISNKISNSYAQTVYSLKDWSIYDQKIAKTPDGRLILYSYIKVELEDTSKNNLSSMICILTYLD